MNEEVMKRLGTLSEQERRQLLAQLLDKKIAKPKTAPLSFAQQRLWFINQLYPGDAAYNMFSATHLRGPLNVVALEQSFQRVVQRHESLRTTFQSAEGEPRQVIATTMHVGLTLNDLSSRPSTPEAEIETQRLMSEEARHPFDLANGPLVRCTLLRLADGEHILLLAMHHIISDGWSMGVLFREIFLLGQAYAAGQEDPLPALPLQYPDFATWQQKWLQGDVLEAQATYWRKKLAGAPDVLNLPGDHPRPARQTYHGSRLPVALPRDTTNRLQNLSRQADATLFMTLLAAFQILLFRYTGQSDILVGSPVANRNRNELEPLIGLFVNTLVLRADLSGKMLFTELLKHVRETCLEAYDHQDLPFEKLVDELQLKRDTSRSPLFQVMFILQNAPISDRHVMGLTLSPLPTENGTAKFDLTLSLTETEAGLTGYFEYNTDLFESETISRMFEHFSVLLDGIADNPQQRLSDLPLLSEAEQEKILRVWNATEVEYPQEKCLAELFEAQVEKTPEAVALVFEKEQFSYRELDKRANQLAHYLQKQGVGPDVLVGICMERSLEMVVGLLGILKAGGAYVPLDPTYPKERLAFILMDSRVDVLLTQTHLQDELPEHKAQVICLDQAWTTISAEKATQPAHSGSPDQLAYVIYTSGSTGKPKGVQVIQRALVNFLGAMLREPGLTAADRLLSVTTLSFDIAGLELYLPLIAGAQVEIASREVAADGFRLRERLKTGGVTMMQATPATWRLLLEAGWDESERIKVLCGGEALPTELARALLARSTSLWNMYGPTETTVWSTLARIESAGRTAPIGRPIANTQVYVLDPDLNLAPTGVAGELYIGGDGLARGYLNRPGLTAERFIPDVFGGQAGGRLYRTGDLVRWLPDGNLEYLGRIDFQVKIRGHRIELGEIESLLVRQVGVHQAVVSAREDQPGDKRLVAYMVREPGADVPVSGLRQALKAELPEYMIPSVFVFLDQLPLTPNGKIDRKALPVPHSERRDVTSGYAAPRSPAEETLVNLWAEVIGVKQPGIHDNFFELGGDSLQVMRVIAKANAAGLHFTPQDFFQHQTIAELAEIGQTSRGTPIQAGESIETGPLPLMPLIMYNYASNLPQSWWRVLVAIVELPRAIGPEQLKEIVQSLVVQHDNLRLRLVKENDNFRLFLADAEEQAFLELDLSGLAAPEQDAAIEAAVDEQWAILNFSTGPLFRIVFFDLGFERLPRILIIVHHFAADGFSTGILMNDFQAACQQILMREPVRLPAKTTSVKEWAERMFEYVHSEAAGADIDYWKSRPWPDMHLTPVDHPEVTHSPAARWTESLGADETQILLKKVPAVCNVELLDVLLTACIVSHARHTPLKLFTISLLYHGRNLSLGGMNLHRTVGNFYTPYPLFFDVKQVLDLQSLEQVLALVAETRAQVPHGGATWPWISYYSTEKIAPWEKKIPNAFFNYLGQTTLEMQNKSGLLRNLYKPVETTIGRLYSVKDMSPHTCATVVEGDRFKINWEYYSALDDHATIERLVQSYVAVLRSFIQKAR